MAFSIPFKPAVLIASLSADQDLTATEEIAWNTTDVNLSGSGGISLDTVTNVGRFTLTGGWTYRITCNLEITHSASAGLTIELYDVTNTTILKSVINIITATSTSNGSGNGMGIWVVRPASDTTYVFRESSLYGSTANADIAHLHSQLVVESIGPA